MEVAKYNLKLEDNWFFHFGELDMVSKIPVPLAHATSKAGGALKELDMFSDGIDWKQVTVPHDWATELPFDKTTTPASGYKNRGTGWYYISFELEKKDIESARLVFDGILGKCEVFVNGVVVARNFSGYNRFSAEIGDYLLAGGKNEIAVHVDARRWEGWWYEGAGIYRNAYIEFREYTHFDKEKSFIKTEKNTSGWEINADLSVIGMSDDIKLGISLKDASNNVIYKNISKCIYNCIEVENPNLWTPENPYIYILEVELIKDEKVLDSFTSNVGFRHIEWKADEGMLINGKKVPVKGICCHQDHAGVGAAVTKEIMEYRISILKKMGVNAYRCAHHAPDEQLLNICDKLGMLVMVENRHFSVSEDVLNQLDSLVYVSRNHPCVFLYCLFNEEPWQEELRGKKIAGKMRARIVSLDNTRAIIGAQNGGLLEKSNASDSLDLIGVNYFLGDYEKVHERAKDKLIIGTENSPMYATRGVYKSDEDKQIFACYGDEWPAFSERLEETMEVCFSRSYVAGCFVWNGFDFRGEPTPYEWPSMLSHWCYNDYCGFPKDTAYLLGAYYRNDLFVHLLPHWNYVDCDNIAVATANVCLHVRVCAFTNADTAELFINEKSAGIRTVCEKRAEWRVPYEKGKIKVVATKDGKTVSDEVKTAQSPSKIMLSDVTPNAQNSNVHIINLSAVDSFGTVAPYFCGKLEFHIENLVLLGVGNGNPNSMHDEKAKEINFFNGYAQIIVKGKTGSLVAKCDGLKDGVIKF